MKKLMYFGLAALMLGLLSTACTDPIDSSIAEEGKSAGGNKVVFRASLEQLVPETKTALGAGNTVVWSAGDQIRVFNEDNPEGINFTLTNGAGSSEGEFAGTITGAGPYYAFYPATLVPTFSTSPLSLSAGLPPFQYYAANSFESGASVSWAVANDINHFQFHNALGAVKFTLKGDAKIEFINLYTRGNEVLSGTLTITGLDGSPSVDLTGALKEENQFVQIACPGDGIQLNPSTGVDFYMTVPAGTLADGFFVEFIDKAGGAMIKGAKGGSLNTVERSVILEMPEITYAPQYKKAFLKDPDDFSAYCGVDAAGSATKACTYTKGKSQFAYYNTDNPGSRYVRFQDWTVGYSLAFQIPVKDLTIGAKPTVTVKAQDATGGIASTSGPMTVIKKTADRAWLYDDATKNGFVIKLED